jgi:hypothetical protein
MCAVVALQATTTASGLPMPSKLTTVLTGVAGATGALYVGLLNPTTHTLFAPCPLHTSTGIWCPGCGLTRGTHALLTGHLGASLGYNLFTPLVVIALVYWWSSLAVRSFTSRRLPVLIHPSRTKAIVLIAAALVFTVLRNLHGTPFAALAP